MAIWRFDAIGTRWEIETTDDLQSDAKGRVAAKIERFDLRAHLGSENDHWDHTELFIIAALAQELPSIHPGHQDIKHDT